MSTTEGQTGAIALAPALMLLVMLTLIALSAAQIGIGDLRSVAAEVHAQQVQAAAEAALARGLAYARRNVTTLTLSDDIGWQRCDIGDIAVPSTLAGWKRTADTVRARRKSSAARNRMPAAFTRWSISGPAATGIRRSMRTRSGWCSWVSVTASAPLALDETDGPTRAVGDYMHRVLPKATLRIIENVGHCPHLSAPGPCADAMDEFLASIGR